MSLACSGSEDIEEIAASLRRSASIFSTLLSEKPSASVTSSARARAKQARARYSAVRRPMLKQLPSDPVSQLLQTTPRHVSYGVIYRQRPSPSGKACFTAGLSFRKLKPTLREVPGTCVTMRRSPQHRTPTHVIPATIYRRYIYTNTFSRSCATPCRATSSPTIQTRCEGPRVLSSYAEIFLFFWTLLKRHWQFREACSSSSRSKKHGKQWSKRVGMTPVMSSHPDGLALILYIWHILLEGP